MASSMNAYEKLYSNMKNRFTVVNNNNEYSLGEYMLLRAENKKNESALPVVNNSMRQVSAISSFLSYVNDKLMVKEAPSKDKVIRSFPFRTAASAILSALVVCTFVISYGIASLNSYSATNSNETYISVSEEVDENESSSVQAYDFN